MTLELTGWLILFALCATAFIESFALIGIFVPGVVMLFSLAALANAQEIPLIITLLSAGIGALIGDIASFYIGNHLQDRIDNWRWFRRHQSWLDQGRWFIERWGWLSVVVGRFLGPIRPVVPLVAGTLGMPGRTFVPLSLVTVCAWAPVYIFPGYFTGELADLWRLQPLSTRALLMYGATLCAVGIALLLIYHHAHPERHGPPTSSWQRRISWPAVLAMVSSGLALIFLPHELPNAALIDQWLNQVAHANHISTLLAELVITAVALWLCLQSRFGLALLWTAILTAVLIISSRIWPNLALLLTISSAMGTLTLISANQQTPLQRWPTYLFGGISTAIVCFLLAWQAHITIRDMVCIILGIFWITGLFRFIWQGALLNSRVAAEGPFIMLMLLAIILPIING